MSRRGAPGPETIAARVLDLERRVAVLEARQRTREDQDVAVIRAIAAAAGGLTFTASSLRERADVDRILAAALRDAAIGTAREIGAWLRRSRGRILAGYALDRIGRNEDGAIWTVTMTQTRLSHVAPCAGPGGARE